MKNFIKARLNKDNFWNVATFLVTLCITGLVEAVVKHFSKVALIPCTSLAFLFSLYLLSFFNKVNFADKEILNSRGTPLNSLLPLRLDNVLFIIIFGTAFIFFPFFLLEGFIIMDLLITNIAAFVLSIPTVYFIFKNCPISILFNKKAWTPEITGIQAKNNAFKDKNGVGSIIGNNYLNPANSWQVQNIFHKKR